MNYVNCERLRIIMRYKGFTIGSLAKISGVSKNTIREAVYNVRTPTLLNARKIAHALQLTPAEIIEIFFLQLKGMSKQEIILRVKEREADRKIEREKKEKRQLSLLK